MKRSRWGRKTKEEKEEEDALRSLLIDAGAGVDGDASDKKETKLFIGNVARDYYESAAATADALRAVFGEYGKVDDVQ